MLLSQLNWAGYFSGEIATKTHTNPEARVWADISGEAFGTESCARMVETPTFFFHLLQPQVPIIIQ